MGGEGAAHRSATLVLAALVAEPEMQAIVEASGARWDRVQHYIRVALAELAARAVAVSHGGHLLDAWRCGAAEVRERIAVRQQSRVRTPALDACMLASAIEQLSGTHRTECYLVQGKERRSSFVRLVGVRMHQTL